jgi:hypothetical protein
VGRPQGSEAARSGLARRAGHARPAVSLARLLPRGATTA